MGLSGSGKTTLARYIVPKLGAKWLNADEIRKEYNDWDFSTEGRIRQAKRMRELAGNDLVVCDFIAPLKEQRDIFNPDFTIWMDTVERSNFSDTDSVFEPPEADFVIPTKDVEFWGPLTLIAISDKRSAS